MPFLLGLPRTRNSSCYNLLCEIKPQILGRWSQERTGTCVGKKEVSSSVAFQNHSLKCTTRMNVAITRAKELLVVIGNAVMLSKHDPYWKAFLQFALRHKLYVLFLSNLWWNFYNFWLGYCQVRRPKTFPRNGWKLYLEIGVSHFIEPQSGCRLELFSSRSALLSKKGASDLDPEERGVVVAGGVAREVLRDWDGSWVTSKYGHWLYDSHCLAFVCCFISTLLEQWISILIFLADCWFPPFEKSHRTILLVLFILFRLISPTRRVDTVYGYNGSDN